MIAKLLSARFLIALALTGTFCALSLLGKIQIQAFMAIFAVVIRDYFDRKDRKNGNTRVD